MKGEIQVRRDMEYVIQMLKDIAKGEYKPVLYISHKFTPEFITEEEEIENKKYIYHLEILEDVGLIDYEMSGMSGGYLLSGCPRLTWGGNDFLDMVENESLWSKTKDTAKDKGVDLLKLPLDLIVSYTKLKASELLGISID